MTDKSCTYFLFIAIIILCYGLYEKDKENSRLYKICVDQESVIKLQQQAIQSQAYLKQLEMYYKNNSNSPIIQWIYTK